MSSKELNRKRKLSKAVLEMKFMKKTKDKEDKQREIEESQALFSDQITDEMKSGGYADEDISKKTSSEDWEFRNSVNGLIFQR